MDAVDRPDPPHHDGSPAELPLFTDLAWQMTVGERAGFEGLLAAVRPRLAIEIGTADGASLRKIAEHCPEVHSFDLVAPSLPGLDREGITLHTGDGHELLPRQLARLAGEGRNVDFVLVDGDHSAEGARQDVEDLLASDAIRETVIVAHDSSNEEVRRGLDAVDYDGCAKVVHVDLDVVPGHLGREDFPGQIWGGLGVIVVSASQARGDGTSPLQRRHEDNSAALAAARDAWAARRAPAEPATARAEPESSAADRERITALEREVEHHRALWRALMASPSWRVTAPLRAAKRAVGRRSH